MNFKENENDDGKMNHINKTLIDQDLDIETNLQNMACLGKANASIYKQH